MRCPQCGKRVRIDFSSVRLVVADALLLQIRCETCNAFIVLHASLQGAEKIVSHEENGTKILSNASSALGEGEAEVRLLRERIEQAGGSFEKLFHSGNSGPRTEIA
jgi:hypothetical protein